MKKILTFFYLLTFYCILYSQSYNYGWAKNIGNNTKEIIPYSMTYFNNNIYVTGRISGSVFDMDPGIGVTNIGDFSTFDDYEFIAKYNSNGALKWAKAINSTGFISIVKMVQNNNGSIYLIGSFADSIDFDPDTTKYMVYSNIRDNFLLKLDSNGVFQWVKTYKNDYMNMHDINIDHADNIYINGYFYDQLDLDLNATIYNLSGPGNNVFMSKYNASGDLIWAKSSNNSGNTCITQNIKFDKNNNQYYTGYFNGSLDINLTSGVEMINSSGDFDMFLACYDSAGNYKWVKKFGGEQYDVPTKLEIDHEGNMLLAGEYYSDSIDLDPSTANFNLYADTIHVQSFLLKMDSQANFTWAYNIAPGLFDMKCDTSNNILIAGNFFTMVDFDPDTNYSYLNPSLNNSYLYKLNKNGIFQFTKNIGSGIQFMQLDEYANIYTSGYFYSTVDFDPSEVVHNLNAGNYPDLYIQKLVPCNSFSYATIADTSCPTKLLFGNIYPQKSGIYKRFATNYLGCDSIITLNLIVIDSSVTLDTIEACDSFVFQSTLFKFSDYLRYRHTNYLGCDSIYSLRLIINRSTTRDFLYLECDSFIFNNIKFDTTSYRVFRYSSISHCDSVIRLTVNITKLDRTISQFSDALFTYNAGANFQWYDCENKTIIRDATSSMYRPTRSGSYAVILHKGVCRDTSECYDFIGTNIANNSIDNVVLYPNPANDYIQIEFNQVTDYTLEIFDAIGNSIETFSNNSKQTKINLSNYASGIYTMKLYDKNMLIGTKKIIKY